MLLNLLSTNCSLRQGMETLEESKDEISSQSFIFIIKFQIYIIAYRQYKIIL